MSRTEHLRAEAEAIANVIAVFPSARIIAVEQTREQRDRRYRAGLCIDCAGRKHSAGRPRCDECHHIHCQRLAGPVTAPKGSERDEHQREAAQWSQT